MYPEMLDLTKNILRVKRSSLMCWSINNELSIFITLT
jgi:hypothetical protein